MAELDLGDVFDLAADKLRTLALYVNLAALVLVLGAVVHRAGVRQGRRHPLRVLEEVQA